MRILLAEDEKALSKALVKNNSHQKSYLKCPKI